MTTSQRRWWRAASRHSSSMMPVRCRRSPRLGRADGSPRRVRKRKTATRGELMKIAVVGTGSVGGSLGRRFAELGHSVCFGVRDLADADANKLVRNIKGDARLASVRHAAQEAEVVVLATPYAANA